MIELPQPVTAIGAGFGADGVSESGIKHMDHDQATAMQATLTPMGIQSAETMALEATKALRSTQLSATRGFAEPAPDEPTNTLRTAPSATDTLREKVSRGSGAVTKYTRDAPLKALLVAASLGALLVGTLALLVRQGR